jgi:hypothetical protein
LYRRYIILYNIHTATFGTAISLHPTPEKIHEVRQKFREGLDKKRFLEFFLRPDLGSDIF